MKRLFTFGCSFTNYKWPTWAEIAGKDNAFEYFENWGQVGAGNFFIFNSIIECNKKHQFTKDDTVIVMWSGVTRVDTYKDNEWDTPGNMFNADKWRGSIINHYDFRGLLIRDMSLISATKDILSKSGANFIFLSMLPFNCCNDTTAETVTNCDDVLEFYQDEIKNIRPSVLEVVFNNSWNTRHDMPQDEILSEQEKNYTVFQGAGWPSFKNYLKHHQNLTQQISAEIEKLSVLWKKVNRKDNHPKPLEHLEYLEKIVPEIQVTNDVRKWIREIDQLATHNKDYSHLYVPQWMIRL